MMTDNETQQNEDVESQDPDLKVVSDDAASEEVGESQSIESQLSEATDRALRLQAELENVRKRLRREIDDERKYAMLPLMRDLLPVMDNITRAIEAAEKSSDGSGLLEGVKMMSQQLQTVLTAYHCKEIVAHEQPFDPNLHEAILQQPSADHPPGTVLTVTQPGYQLHERVVRPPQVIVSTEADSQE